jgi:hypothetical protein
MKLPTISKEVKKEIGEETAKIFEFIEEVIGSGQSSKKEVVSCPQ